MEIYNLWDTPRICTGTYLCSIFIDDLFLVFDGIDLANYVNDNTIYCS